MEKHSIRVEHRTDPNSGKNVGSDVFTAWKAEPALRLDSRSAEALGLWLLQSGARKDIPYTEVSVGERSNEAICDRNRKAQAVVDKVLDTLGDFRRFGEGAPDAVTRLMQERVLRMSAIAIYEELVPIVSPLNRGGESTPAIVRRLIKEREEAIEQREDKEAELRTLRAKLAEEATRKQVKLTPCVFSPFGFTVSYPQAGREKESINKTYGKFGSGHVGEGLAALPYYKAGRKLVPVTWGKGRLAQKTGESGIVTLNFNHGLLPGAYGLKPHRRTPNGFHVDVAANNPPVEPRTRDLPAGLAILSGKCLATVVGDGYAALRDLKPYHVAELPVYFQWLLGVA